MSDYDEYTQVPVGQATTIWETFDVYINDLVKANPGVFENDQWYKQWFSMRHILTDWSTNPEIGIAIITNNPQSDLVDAVTQILRDVPFLAADCMIQYDESDRDVISFCIHPYGNMNVNEEIERKNQNEGNINKLADDNTNEEEEPTVINNNETNNNVGNDEDNNVENEEDINNNDEEEDNDNKEFENNESFISYEVTEADNESEMFKDINKLFQGFKLKEIMGLPTKLKEGCKDITNVAEEVADRLDIIQQAVIKSTKATINEYKEEILNNAKNDIRQAIKEEKDLMMKDIDNHFASKMAVSQRMLADIDNKIQIKLNDAKSRVIAFNNVCDQKKTELDTKRKEIEAMRVAPTTPKRITTVKNPYKTPPSRTTTINPTSRIRGGNNTTPSVSSTTPNLETSTAGIAKVNEKYVEFHQPQGMYTLRDNDFKRNSPPLQICKKPSDIVHIYNALESSANSYNIMITPFNDIQVWDKAPNSIPTTCNMDFNVEEDSNLHMVYTRMSSAIYEKLRKTNFLYIPRFNKILNSTRTTDGFVILYKLIESQHPNLTSEQKRPPKPTMVHNTCIYDFISEYENWLDYESISSRTYTPAEKVEYLMDQLKEDDKYEEAYKLVSSQYMIYKQDKLRNHSAPFPHSLLMSNIDSTIATVYSDDDQSILYGSVHQHNDNDSTNNAQVNAMNANPARTRSYGNSNKQRNNYNNNTYDKNQHFYGRLFQSPERANWKRKPIHQWCKCCGTYGHDIFKNGCDFAAKVILVQSFLNRNPNMQRRIVESYQAVQKKNGENRNNQGIMAKRLQENAARRNIQVTGNVRALFDIVGETLENEGLGYEDYQDETTAEIKVIDTLEDMQVLEGQGSQDEYHDSQE